MLKNSLAPLESSMKQMGELLDVEQDEMDRLLKELEKLYVRLYVRTSDEEGIIRCAPAYPSFGSTNEKIHLFCAHCIRQGESEKEPCEILYQEEVSEETFRNMIADGSFMHGAGLAAWTRYGA